MRMRGGGSRSSLRTASSASSRLPRLVAGISSPRAASATVSAGRPFSALRYRHRDQAARQSCEIIQEAGEILGRQHADDQHQRPRHTFLDIGERRGNSAAAVRIMAAVEPQLAAGGREIDEAGRR